jgi:diaminopimelate decarboxylase
MGPLPPTLLPTTATADDTTGRLSIGGCDLLDLAREHGTPLFVYDETHLRERCREAVQAWGDGVAYASKAFLCKAMAQLAHEEGMCIDVSTGGELAVAEAAHVPGHRLVLHGNNKSAAELEQALDHGVGRIVVDSFDEIDRLEAIDRDATVLLRVTPGVEAHTHEFVMTGQEDTKFGFSIASGAAAKAIERLNKLQPRITLAGVHAHIGSQIFVLDSFRKEAEVLARFFTPLGLNELCVGGGLGVPYVTGEEAPTITQWATTIKKAAREAGIDTDRTTITAEPGRAIVAAAAVTLYTVGTIKDLPGIRTYLAVDGGMSDNPRPVLYGSGYEAFLPRAATQDRTKRVRIVGKHCESGDVIVPEAFVPDDTAVGDILATPVTGAYGHSMASNYNKVPRPPVVFVKDGEARVVVRRETYEDLLRLDA